MEHHFPIWQTADQPNYNYRPLNEDILVGELQELQLLLN